MISSFFGFFSLRQKYPTGSTRTRTKRDRLLHRSSRHDAPPPCFHRDNLRIPFPLSDASLPLSSVLCRRRALARKKLLAPFHKTRSAHFSFSLDLHPRLPPCLSSDRRICIYVSESSFTSLHRRCPTLPPFILLSRVCDATGVPGWLSVLYAPLEGDADTV